MFGANERGCVSQSSAMRKIPSSSDVTETVKQVTSPARQPSSMTSFNNNKNHQMYSSLLEPTAQDTDSGYETSPSSNNGCCTFSFEDSKLASLSTASNTENSDKITGRACDEEAEFDDGSWTVLMEYAAAEAETDPFDLEETEDDDLLNNCSLESCVDGEDSDVSPCNSYKEHRPSSLPISIPVPRDSPCRGSSDLVVPSVHTTSLPLGTSVQIPVAQQPPSSSTRSSLHPLSWPVLRPLVDWWLKPSVDRGTMDPRPGHAVSSSPKLEDDAGGERDLLVLGDDGPNEVFEESGSGHPDSCTDENTETSPADSTPTIAHDNLPDDDDDGSSSTQQKNPVSANRTVQQRSRSTSVNLPLERDLQQNCLVVGQMLRRLSDQFHPRNAAWNDAVKNHRFAFRARERPLTVHDIRRLSCTG